MRFEQGKPIYSDKRGGPGFSLDVNYEFIDPILPEEPESLAVGVSRYESDTKAAAFVRLFGKLERYRRIDPEQANRGHNHE